MRIHAYENQLFQRVDYLAICNDTMVDALREDIPRQDVKLSAMGARLTAMDLKLTAMRTANDRMACHFETSGGC